MSNKYKEILDKIIWSFSTVHQYDKCPYSIYLKKIEELNGDTNAYAEIGHYGHELNEKIFKQECSVDEALAECVEEFDDHVWEAISESSKEKKYIALCDYLASFDENYTENYEIIGVEKKFYWKIGRFNCIGLADLILKRKADNKIFLIDHKSAPHFLKKDGTPLKNQAENFAYYSKQMYLYSDAMRKNLGYYPDYLVWNHFLDDSVTVIPFDKCGLDETIKWFKETVKRIYSDETFEAKHDYVMCNTLCDYRNGLCDYKDLWKSERSGE